MARVALVTGGMGGIGEAISIRLASAGFKVAVTHSPTNTKVDRWLSEMKSLGHDFFAVGADVADFHSCEVAVRKVEAELGLVDVLINNAGITKDVVFKRMTKTDWDSV